MVTTDQLTGESTRRRTLVHTLSVIGLGTGVFIVAAATNYTPLIAAFVLMGILALALWKPDLATLGVVFALWANVAAIAVRFYNVPAIVAVASFLALGLPLFYHVVIRRQPVRTNGVLGLMLVYLIVQVASAELSADIAASFPALAVFGLQGIVLYFLVLNTVRTPAQLQRCIWAMVLAGVLLGTLSFIQRITHSYKKDFAGFAVSHTFIQPPDTIDPNDSPEEGNDQAFLALYPTWRAMGSLGDPNYYAQIMIVLVPIALLRLWVSPNWRERVPALLALAGIIAGVVLSYSRGGAVALCGVFAGLIVFRYLRVRYALAAVIAVILILAITDPMFIRRVQTLGSESKNPLAVDRSILMRQTYLIGGWHMFLDHPLLGVGFGQSPSYLPRYGRMYGYVLPPRDAPTHNMFLQVLCETGIVGFGVFLLVIWAVVRPMVVLRNYWARSRPEYAHTLASLMLGLLAFLAAGIFLHLAFTRYLYLLLGLCGAAVAIYTPEAESTATVPLQPVRKSRSEIGAAWYEA
jgi:hypothetical protein